MRMSSYETSPPSSSNTGEALDTGVIACLLDAPVELSVAGVTAWDAQPR
jgi:hypothetical protein